MYTFLFRGKNTIDHMKEDISLLRCLYKSLRVAWVKSQCKQVRICWLINKIILEKMKNTIQILSVTMIVRLPIWKEKPTSPLSFVAVVTLWVGFLSNVNNLSNIGKFQFCLTWKISSNLVHDSYFLFLQYDKTCSDI